MSPPATQAPEPAPVVIPAWIEEDADTELARLYPLWAMERPLPAGQSLTDHHDRLRRLWWHFIGLCGYLPSSKVRGSRREALETAMWILQGEMEGGNPMRGLPTSEPAFKAPAPRRHVRTLGHCPSPSTRLH